MEAISTKLAPLPRGFYSQAVRVGEFLFISGQLPLNQVGQAVNGPISKQAHQAFSNVQAILKGAGGNLSDLVQCTIYISDVGHWIEVDRIYTNFLSGVSVPPARAIVPVKELHYGALIEIQAIAYLKRSKSS